MGPPRLGPPLGLPDGPPLGPPEGPPLGPPDGPPVGAPSFDDPRFGKGIGPLDIRNL